MKKLLIGLGLILMVNGTALAHPLTAAELRQVLRHRDAVWTRAWVKAERQEERRELAQAAHWRRERLKVDAAARKAMDHELALKQAKDAAEMAAFWRDHRKAEIR